MKIIRESFGIQYILPTFAALININALPAKRQNKHRENINGKYTLWDKQIVGNAICLYKAQYKHDYSKKKFRLISKQ